MRNSIRAFTFLVLALPFFFAPSLAIAAEDKPDATLTFKATDFGFMFRVEWGQGRLSLADGSHRAFSVKGGAVLGAGVAELTATGKVYNLKKLEDFNGNYTRAEAGITVIEGKKVAIMKNGNGVSIHMVAHQEGVQLSLGAGGLDFQLK